jgi:hypothetical protein
MLKPGTGIAKVDMESSAITIRLLQSIVNGVAAPAVAGQGAGAAGLTAIRSFLRSGRPLGEPSWVEGIAERLGINQQPWPRGRPRKEK